MPEKNKIFPERRLSAAERRAGRRFIAQLMEECPRLARLAYPIRGEGGIVYVRMPIPPEKASAVNEFAAALTGIIHEQEKISVLLIPDDFSSDEPIAGDDDLKLVQAQMSCDIDLLRKLRRYQDTEAFAQKAFYTKRIKSLLRQILDYLNE